MDAAEFRANRDLFSNYYLDEHLPETEEWDAVDDDILEAVFEDFVDLWDREGGLVPRLNESQLEARFIRPMFDELGIPYEVEESTSRTQRRPDYGFFESDEAARGAFDRRDEGGDFYKDAVAVADAKRWNRPLDTRGSGEHERDFENPSYQIHVYLQETPVQWAVLTNGRKWRLYYGPTSHRLDSYYEVDLPAILEDGDLEAFKYFYLFFRHEAFIEDATGDSFLDDVYEESNVFAQELGEDLQDNIYEGIRVLSEGFLEYPDNDLTADDLDLVHDSALIYLYRLIFVLYAEAEGRELLETDNRIYRESYSLNTLKQEVAEELNSPSPKYRDWQTDLWSRIDELFTLIDQGSRSHDIPEEDLYIPAYDGGLFRTDPDPDDTPESQFLAEHAVGDAYLAEVIELLTRSRNGSAGEKIFVDYSSLDVRHLGSIYEGLLEYNLNVAEEPLGLEDGEYVPVEGGNAVEVEPGALYLTTDRGERKATGSYYTPEYVVEYIVENTLGPLVEEIREELVGTESYEEGGFADEFAEHVFGLKVLDPAMGSGHFLTSAVDYLAREIIDAQERQAAQQGIETVDEAHDINWARRQVAQRCIYGVDVNPLATELAKVSLWLRTLAAEQPLAFLDHHLKTGNSLVGSDIEDVLANGEADTDDGQLTLRQSFDRTRRQALEHVTERFQELLAFDNETLEDVKEMEAVFEEVRDDLLYQHLLAMANVHTADAFGLDVPSDAYERMAGALRDDTWTEIESQVWYQSAQAMAEEERFFHWELEFPVAFYGEDGERDEDAGFDAVIGNPPYAEIQRVPEAQTSYFNAIYQTPSGNYDLYVVFVEKGVTLLNNEGRFGYIIPNKVFRVDYGEGLRAMISENQQVSGIVDFGSNQVFDETATTYTTILLLEGTTGEMPFTYWKLDDDSDPASLNNLGQNQSGQWSRRDFEHSTLSEAPWTFHTQEIESLINSVEAVAAPLGEITDAIGRGTSSGSDEIFELQMIDQEQDTALCSSEVEDEFPIENDILRKPIHSTDFDKYLFSEEEGKRLIWPYDSDYNLLDEEQFASRYTDAWAYLERHREELEERADYSKWYDYSAPRNLSIHDQAEILVPLLANGPAFAEYPKPQSEFILMASGGFAISLDHDLEYDPRYILSLINSKVLFLCLRSISNVFRGGYITCTKQYFRELPIRKIDFVTPIEERASLLDDARASYTRYIEQNKGFYESELRDFVDSLIEDGKNDVVHDLLAQLASEASDLRSQRHGYNLNILDYLGNYPDGPNLPEAGLFQPTGTDILDSTTEDYEKLNIGEIRIDRDGSTVTIYATARYKLEDEAEHETDRWGYTETDHLEAFTLTDLTETEAALAEAFVPAAVEEGDGFAGFRANATKTISPLDRLKAITLPDPDDVEDDLRRYLEVKERADELDEQIEKTDQLIDEIVYDLYGLTDEEIEIVESAMQGD